MPGTRSRERHREFIPGNGTVNVIPGTVPRPSWGITPPPPRNSPSSRPPRAGGAPGHGKGGSSAPRSHLHPTGDCVPLVCRPPPAVLTELGQPTALGTGQGIHVAAYFGHEGHEGQRGYRNTGNTGTSGTPGTELIQEDGGHRTRGTQGIWENGGQKSMRYRGYWHIRNGGTQEHS